MLVCSCHERRLQKVLGKLVLDCGVVALLGVLSVELDGFDSGHEGGLVGAKLGQVALREIEHGRRRLVAHA